MKFNIRPLDGSSGRLADRISFLTAAGTVAWAAMGNQGFQFADGDVTSVPHRDLTVAAEQIAGLLCRHQDASLVIHPTSVGITRGDGATTPDVYPPGAQPRIIVQG